MDEDMVYEEDNNFPATEDGYDHLDWEEDEGPSQTKQPPSYDE